VAVIATFYFIKQNDFEDTLKLAEKLLDHDHHLIHKAVGWMPRNTVHLDHLKRFMPIAGYGSSRSPETVHADHQIRSKPISFGGGILKYQFAIGQLRPKSKFTSNLEERWTQRPWPQGGYPCGRFEKS